MAHKMNPNRRDLLLNSPRFSAKSIYGIPWEPYDRELVPSVKILVIGDYGLDSITTWRDYISNNLITKHSITPDTFILHFYLGEHEVEIQFCILRRDITNINYKQKMFSNLDAICFFFSTASNSSYSNVLIKYYPQASQFTPETSIFIVGVQTDIDEHIDISDNKIEELCSSTSATSSYKICFSDLLGIDNIFDQVSRNAICERINRGFSIDKRIKLKHSKPKKLSNSFEQAKALDPQFIETGSVEELEILISAKVCNFRVTEGRREPPMLLAIYAKNYDFAQKLLELENGVVNFNDCSLEEIPEKIIEWSANGLIKEINLNQNMLQAIPIELKNVKKVNITQNPLQAIPVDIRHSKWSKIKKYLFQIENRAANWDTRKLLLVGEEAVGKSTLVKCLTAKTGKTDTSINLATDGIDIHEIEIYDDNKEKVLFSTWDMGGQLIFYPTHQFFLTNGSIYIVVFNFSDINYSRIEYWMKQIKVLGTECSSSLIMVGTHAENCTELEISEITGLLKIKFPKRAYPAFKSVIIPVSAKTGQGIRELKKILFQIAKSDKENLVPVSWVQLHEMLKLYKENTNYISWNTYCSWATQCGIHEEHLEMATMHLYTSGSLIYFNNEDLKDLVILNPQWLADIMSCLITVKNNFVEKGYIASSKFVEIFRNFANIQDLVTKLFEQFKIIYPLNREKTLYIVPSLLPNVRPSKDISNIYPSVLPVGKSSFGRIINFGQLPLGLFGRVMVSVLNLQKIVGKVFWRSGLVLSIPISKSSECQSIIEYDNERYILSVYIRFPIDQRNTAVKEWRSLIEVIKTITESFYPQLKGNMKEMIPCTHCIRRQRYLEKVHLFLYSECDNAYRKGEGFLYCQGIPSPSRCVFVSELAPDIYLADLPRLNGDLQIDKILGEGGFGTVYKGTLNNEVVAVKELKELQSSSEFADTNFQAFQREAYLMSLLNHPNIVHLYGVMINPPRMVIQYVDGTDLFQFLHPENNSGEITYLPQEELLWKNRLQIAYNIANGLHYLQSITPPVVHRDLRSPNIFVTKTYDALIGDFGLARLVQGAVGGYLRTWQWLAPEIYDNITDNYDERADIYSFGIILWELAAIDIPFEKEIKNGKNEMEIKNLIIEEHYRPIIPEDVPDKFKELIESCWTADPLQRPSTAKIINVLKDLLDSYNISPPKPDEDDDLYFDLGYPSNIPVSFPTMTPPVSAEVCEYKEDSFPPLSEIIVDKTNISELMCASVMVGDQLWVGLRGGLIKIYNFNSKIFALEQTGELIGHKRKITQLIRTDANVLSSSEDGSIIVWNIRLQTKMYSWKPCNSESVTLYLKYVPSSKNNKKSTIWIVSPFEGKITIWNTKYEIVHSITQEQLIGACSIECHRNMIFVGVDTSRLIHIYNIQNYDFMGSFGAHTTPVTTIYSFGPYVWTLSLEDIRVWYIPRLEDLNCIHIFPTLASRPRAIIQTVSGKHILTAAMDGSVLLWDSDNCKLLQELLVTCDHEAGIFGISDDSTMKLWCVSPTRIGVWPKSEDLHTNISHILASLQNLRPKRATVSINTETNSSSPYRSKKKKEPLQSKFKVNPRGSTPSLSKRERAIFSDSPVSPRSILQRNCSVPVVQRAKMPEAEMRNSDSALDKRLNNTNESTKVLTQVSTTIKRKKKKLTVVYEDTTQRVSSSITLTKLINIIPDMDIEKINDNTAVEIICEKINGKLQVTLSKKDKM